MKTSAKESEIVREESDYFFCKRMGIPAMVAHLLEEGIGGGTRKRREGGDSCLRSLEREEAKYFLICLITDIPTDKTCTTKVIEDMRRLVESNEDTRFKIWALCTVWGVIRGDGAEK